MRLNSIYSFLIAGLFFSYILSCQSNKKGTSGGQDSVLIQYQALIDSVDHNWFVMISDDDDKHVLMKRLLLEVSYTNNYDKARYQELNEMIDQLKGLRYDQKSMGNSLMIDAYDSATFDLSDQVIVFARSHPRFEDTPMMSELIDDINRKNNYILMHRIHYDNWVKELNAFKKKNKKKLLSSEPPIDVESMPLFELSS